MIYEFRDTIAGASSEDYGHLPTSAMMYNGQYIENVIEGYRTLKVTGREMISLDISSDAVRVGTIVSEQRVNPRVLTVEYLLSDNDPEELQNKFKKLMLFLYQEEDVEITFNDDPQIYYYGRYSESDDVPGDSNSVISSFTIYCQDPRKYSKLKETGNSITINSPLQTTPERLEVKLVRNSSLKIRNKNTGIEIRITGAAIYAGDFVVFDFDLGLIFVNGNDMTKIADLNSGFENFVIRRGDILECDNGSMAIYAREVYL
ncbi:distal tail protein Dit [Candidatus Enterococcus ferrettii]|uniref:Siphovirus-type tail component RIFT-related domain-containing protein n=1 Tax=Candidatus Enterococcus ferrettii TaxID=2815324 RepID=A0ABV0ELI4_9ENTE|nr:distal tail protein Dit [Enterococcus sp. 665A]MBO1341900.1 phage tail family protein [Enterococcus sp. 665A]